MDTSSRMNFENLAFGNLKRTNPCIKYVDSDGTSSTPVRIIIVSNMLPLHAQKDGETKGLIFNYDEDSPLWQLKDGFSPDTVIFYAGSLSDFLCRYIIYTCQNYHRVKHVAPSCTEGWGNRGLEL